MISTLSSRVPPPQNNATSVQSSSASGLSTSTTNTDDGGDRSNGRAARAEPADYAATIESYAQRYQNQFLICGSNFRYLADFINFPPLPLPQRLSQPSNNANAFVRLTCLSPGKARQSKEYINSAGPELFLADSHSSVPGSSHLVFLRGHPSREWLRALGCLYKVEGEYFRRHLEFQVSKKFFDLPALPSGSRNFLRLRYTTIYTRREALTMGEVRQSRKESESAVRRHQQQLGQNLGESIVRRYSVHNETIFHIEQNITCWAKQKDDGGWAYLIWLDTGRDLQESPAGPWLDSKQLGRSFSNECLPIIQHRPMAAVSKEKSNMFPSGPSSGSRESVPSASLLPSQYGLNSTDSLMHEDVMYAFSDVIAFAANSESQFVNLMRSLIDEAIQLAETQEELSLATLRYSCTLLEDHSLYISETTSFLVSGDSPQWGRSKDDAAEGVRRSMIKDFQCLEKRTEAALKKCMSGIDNIVNLASLKESRRAISQAKRVERLTALAFFFIPLSWLSSLFGMNFVEFGQGSISVRVYAFFLVPTLLVSGVLLLWDRLSWNGVKTIFRGS